MDFYQFPPEGWRAWQERAWENRSTSDILFLSVVNCVLRR
jgi:hypothetical protein